METITINNVEKKTTKTGVPYHVVTYNGDLKASAWDETIGGFLTQKVGQAVSVELKTKGDFTNIRACDYTAGLPGVPIVQPSVTNAPSNLMSAKDASIVAQVCVKEANNNLCAMIASGVELEANKYGEFLCENVKELVGAYKFALSELNGI